MAFCPRSLPEVGADVLSRFIKSWGRPVAVAELPKGADGERFAEHLTRVYAAATQTWFDDNFAHDRYGAESDAALAARTQAFCAATFAGLLESPARAAHLYEVLDDDQSRACLIDLIAYRLLGYRHVRLKRNNAEFHAHCARARSMGEAGAGLAGGYGDARRYHLQGESGQQIVLDGWWFNVAWSFLIRQYWLTRGDATLVAAQPGDCVIDAGACFGDTTLAFADAVGAGGQVHAFEVVPDNLAVARHNLSLNPRFAATVRCHAQALGAGCGRLYLHGSGPGAVVNAQSGGQPVDVISIDEYVAREALTQVDFIKMDIEGSESQALDGAIQTLRRFRPKLAISLYHRPEDLTRIPLWVDNLGLGAQLRHPQHCPGRGVCVGAVQLVRNLDGAEIFVSVKLRPVERRP